MLFLQNILIGDKSIKCWSNLLLQQNPFSKKKKMKRERSTATATEGQGHRTLQLFKSGDYIFMLNYPISIVLPFSGS